MKAMKPKGNDYPPIPAGTHTAVVYGIVDEGTQYSERFNKSSPKVRIMFELPKVRIDIQKDGEESKNVPRVTSKEYTLSLHDKSNFTKDCTSLRGTGFSPEELKNGYDPCGLMGVNCLLQIVHTKKDDKVYANIGSIVPLPIGTENIQAESEQIYYDMDQHGFNFPENLHSWLVDIIKKSEEYVQYHQQVGQDHYDPDNPDDIPF
jgi:hypothetical protein